MQGLRAVQGAFRATVRRAWPAADQTAIPDGPRAGAVGKPTGQRRSGTGRAFEMISGRSREKCPITSRSTSKSVRRFCDIMVYRRALVGRSITSDRTSRRSPFFERKRRRMTLDRGNTHVTRGRLGEFASHDVGPR